MTQKTLNRMGKYCKLTGLRFGQLIANITCNGSAATATGLIAHHCSQAIPDADLEKLFNAYILKYPPPPKDHGGYYPHGHKPLNS